MEKEKCIKHLIDILSEENLHIKAIIHMLVPMEQVDEEICKKLNEVIESRCSVEYFEDWGVGILTIKNNSNIYYQLTFKDREHFIGYCMCEPTDEGYNEEHKCCGVHCDWYAPIVIIEEINISKLTQEEYKGKERFLWEEKDKFIDKYVNKELLEKIRIEERRKELREAIRHHRRMLEEYELELDELPKE